MRKSQPEPSAASSSKANKYTFVWRKNVERNIARLKSQLAVLLSQVDDAIAQDNAADVRQRFNRAFYDAAHGRYRDGIGTDHASQHASMTALALGLVDEKEVKRVASYVESRGMACSVYGAQWLLDALYRAEEGEAALNLLTATGKRSWWNMLRVGSTISMEAWDTAYKSNLDWNHAWGAAPANAIPRGLFGIVPTEPGFRSFRIKPQIGTLEHASITVPTMRGDIAVSIKQQAANAEKAQQTATMQVSIPANAEAEVWMPAAARAKHIAVDGKAMKARRNGQYLIITLGSGNYTLTADK